MIGQIQCEFGLWIKIEQREFCLTRHCVGNKGPDQEPTSTPFNAKLVDYAGLLLAAQDNLMSGVLMQVIFIRRAEIGSICVTEMKSA